MVNGVVNAGEVKASAMEEVWIGSSNFPDDSSSDSSTDLEIVISCVFLKLILIRMVCATIIL